MQDLVDTMGINRASIYSTYGDKRTLFMQALNHYDDTYRRALLNQIGTENTPRNAIMALFEGVVHETLMNGNRTDVFWSTPRLSSPLTTKRSLRWSRAPWRRPKSSLRV